MTPKEIVTYVNQRFKDADKAKLAAVSSVKEAMEKALTANEKRLEALNELRGDVSTKGDFTALQKELTIKIESLERLVYQNQELRATKENLEAINKELCIKVDAQAKRIDTLFRIVFIGIGIFTAFEIILRITPMLIK